MNELHLYIGGEEIEFQEKPEVLYTYQMDDITNPTVVKNSFSKTITVKGTRKNNHLFGHYWNVERVQVGGGANSSNVYFNASKKMEFQLFVGTELYESGYVKLDEVRRVGDNYEYDITLYGGLGDFFYNLSINDDGNEMKLANLDLGEDIDFTINIQTVKDAWTSLKEGKDDKWQIINFMPAYNGLPDDFDSKKMLIDTSSTNLTKRKTEDGKTYTTKENWVMAELPEDMTEWETRDLRSYLQRPCIRMKEIIKACCNPKNNGGYEVELDEDFFNENNPYWEDTWLSLPMIQTLEYDSGEQVVDGSKLVPNTTEGDTEGYMYQELDFDMGEYPTSVMSYVYIRATINPHLMYPNASYVWFWNDGGNSYHSGWWCTGSLFCQLLAFNGDTVIGASDAYNLTNPIRHNNSLWYGENSQYEGGHSFTPYMGKSIKNKLGFFEKDGFRLENTKEPYRLDFIIDNLSTNVTSLKMCYYWGASKNKLKKADGAYACFDEIKDVSWIIPDWAVTTTTIPSNMDMSVLYHNIKAVMGGTIGRTGTEITKNIILNSEASPCDYLLSYTKMFGLHFSKSPYEKKIKIETRNSFYDRTLVTDITDSVDYSKSVTITPIAFGSKWVELSQEYDDTQYYKEYMTSKGVSYGCKTINTGYEFNSEKKQLLENNVIKSGVEGLEKSKYFTCFNNDSKVRPFFGYGMKYYLYNDNDTIEVNGSNSNGSNLLGINEDSNLKYYDAFPKLQFHDNNNKPTDVNNCLVFFSGFKNLTTDRANPISYYLTDDSHPQSEMNEGTPCWLFVSGDKTVNGKAIARKVTELPVFERYLTDSNSNTVKKSLDFGTAQELYIPKYSITEDVNIYSNFWKSYLGDLYDVNTKILTVYVRLKNKVGYELMRQFYWFENSIWRINKITDWNIGLEDTTKVEFVKVQDLTDYTSITQTRKNKITLTSSKYNINPNGEVVTLSLTTKNGGSWRVVTNSNSLVTSKTQGIGDSTFTLTIPQTRTPSTPSYYSVTAIDNEGNTSTINITQGYNGETKFKVSPQNLIVPSTGGEYNIQFDWVNQGNNEVTDVSIIGDVDGDVILNDFDATIFVTESKEPDTVISGKVLFSNDLYDAEVGIEQIPQSLSFDSGGGSYEFVYNYNTGVTYEEIPYWATMSGNKLTVLPNYYESERVGNILVKNSNSSAYVELHQQSGKTPSVVSKMVSPDNLYFGSKGGLQYINIQIPNSWIMEKVGDWFTTNVSNGDGETIVGVSCGANSGNKKDGVITIRDAVTDKTYSVTLSQIGEVSQQELSVSPSHIDTDYKGGEYDIVFTYTNRNGGYVELESKGLTLKNMKWNGDVSTGKVVVPENNTTEIKNYELKFKTAIGNISITITQGSGLPDITVDKKNINFEYEGGTIPVYVTSNTTWNAEASDTWLRVSTTTGGVGTTDIILEVDKNKTETNRVGYIYLSDNSGNRMATITVTQMRIVETLEVTPTFIEFAKKGGTETITIICNTDWIIELNE